jgi:ATP-binding cassette, subfamily B, bacterial MsbA
MVFSSLKSWFTDPEKDGWVIRRILTDYGYGQAKSYALALALGAVAAASTAGTAFIVGTVVNQAYVDRNLQSITALAIFIILIFVVKGLAMYGSNVLLARIGFQIVAEMQRRLFDKLMIEGLGYFANRHSTQLLAKMNRGARSAADLLKMVVNSLGRDLLTLIGLAAVMLIQDPRLSIVGFVIMPPAVYFVRGLMRRTRDIARRELGGAMKIFETIQETIRGFAVVKAFTLEEVMRKRIRAQIASVEGRQYNLSRIENRASPIMEALGGIAIALVLLYGGYSVIELGATPGEFVSFITAFLLAYEPAKRIARGCISASRAT